jgi:hypothetical protein
MPSLFFTCPKTRQQADTGILTDVESLRDTWSMTLNVNCPHCGEMHAVSVRETYIDDAIRNVSEIARGGVGPVARAACAGSSTGPTAGRAPMRDAGRGAQALPHPARAAGREECQGSERSVFARISTLAQ